MGENIQGLLKNIYLGIDKLLSDNDISVESMYYLQMAKDDIEFYYYVEEGILLSEFDNLKSEIVSNMQGIGLFQFINQAMDILKTSMSMSNMLGLKDFGKLNEISFNIKKATKLVK